MIAFIKRVIGIKSDEEKINNLREMLPCRWCGKPQHRTYLEGFECTKKHILEEVEGKSL